MREPFGKWWSRLQFVFLFLALTMLVHALFGWFHGWLKPDSRYKVPEGRAAKVFASGAGGDAADSPGDRLRLFFWYGE